MEKRAGRWLLLILVGALGCLAGPLALAQSIERAVSTVDRALGKLDGAPNIVALSACITQGDTLVYQQAFGQRQLGSGPPVDQRTRFRIASLSKGFAATLAAMLEREEQLSLDEPVVSAVPWFALKDPQQRDRVQLKHLLSHQLGLPPNAYDNLLEANWSPVNIVKRFSAVDPICPVGDCYGYQNVGYNLIADAINTRTGRRFEELVAERLFKPLDLADAGFGAAHLQHDDNWARPHIGRGRWLRQGAVKESYYRVPASAGINASTRDVCRWLMAQAEAFPAVVDAQLLAQLQTPRVHTARELYSGRWRRTRLRDAQYARGWRVFDYAGQPLIFHAGAVQGYGATIALLPQSGVGLAALWNSESIRTWGLVPDFLDAYLGLRAEDWMKLRDLGGGSAAAAATGD